MTIEEILKKSGTLTEGHFLLTSGKHTDQYFQCAKILKNPAYCKIMLEKIIQSMPKISVDLVISPATGGIIVGYELASQLQTESIFAERENGVMTLRRNFTIPKHAKVIIAEDVITTGSSVRELENIVKQAGATLLGICVLVDRSGNQAKFSVPLYAAYSTYAKTYDPNDCPLCKENNIPLQKPGSRNL